MIWSGFILGLLGSLHCVGMCGPLAMALPGFKQPTSRFIKGRILYNLGRAVSYAMMGLLFGAIGFGFYFAGIQQALTITVGVLILLNVMPVLFKIRNPYQEKFTRRLKKMLSPLLHKSSPSNLFSVGLLNGFLPCGFVYLAIAGAMLAGSAANGALFMFLFGLGTFPLMFLLSMSSRFATPKFRLHITRFVPYIASVIAVLLILRGLNLGIPYLSPQIADDHAKVEACCHK